MNSQHLGGGDNFPAPRNFLAPLMETALLIIGQSSGTKKANAVRHGVESVVGWLNRQMEAFLSAPSTETFAPLLTQQEHSVDDDAINGLFARLDRIAQEEMEEGEREDPPYGDVEFANLLDLSLVYPAWLARSVLIAAPFGGHIKEPEATDEQVAFGNECCEDVLGFAVIGPVYGTDHEYTTSAEAVAAGLSSFILAGLLAVYLEQDTVLQNIREAFEASWGSGIPIHEISHECSFMSPVVETTRA